MLYFRLGSECYLSGGISTEKQIYNNNIELLELDDFSLEDCDCWKYLIFEDGKNLITLNIDYCENIEFMININKFFGSSLKELEKFLKKKKIDFIKCSTY